LGQLVYQDKLVADIDCTIKITYGPLYSWAGVFVIKRSHSANLPKLLLEVPNFDLELPSCRGKILILEQDVAKIEGELGHGIMFQGTGELVAKNK